MSKRNWWLLGGLALLAFLSVGTMTSTFDPAIDKFAEAVGLAEGFFVTGSRPARNHNPGDLTVDTTGKAVGKDGMFVVYANDADGWEALKTQVSLMFGGSAFYDPSMTILEIANIWTKTNPVAWANTVAGQLGVSVNTTLAQIT